MKELGNTIVTERFRLQPISRWRAFQISYAWTKDAELIRSYTGSAAPRSPWKWYREMVRPNNRTKFAHAIVPHGQKHPIGLHFIEMRPYRSAYLAIAISDRDWWGKNAVQEVRASIIAHLFANAPVDRLCTYVRSRNFPSIFNNRKLGFSHVGTLHRAKQDPVSGEVHDFLIFELFRDEWEQRGGEGS